MEIPVDSKDILKLVASLALSFAAAIVGALAVTPNIAWQDTLSKPFFAPPNWLFGPAWTVLFLLMAIALYLVWQKWPAKEAKWAAYLMTPYLLWVAFATCLNAALWLLNP